LPRNRLSRRKRLALDGNRESVTREMLGDECSRYYFGENVGLLVFRAWYPCITTPGHQANMQTYDFPVRLKFVEQPFDDRPFHESSDNNRGWNLTEWQRCAQELQEEGVRAIVCGCGLTGMIQSRIQATVEIPVVSSTLLYVPEMIAALPKGKRLGIITVGESFLRAHDNALFRECGIDEGTMPLAIAGMYESDWVEEWSTMAADNFDPAVVGGALVNVAKKLVAENPDVDSILIECTDMPPWSDAVRAATGLPVFDPVDMVKRVNSEASLSMKFKTSTLI
jgi:Asp/Glu/hydantoin racemase